MRAFHERPQSVLPSRRGVHPPPQEVARQAIKLPRKEVIRMGGNSNSGSQGGHGSGNAGSGGGSGGSGGIRGGTRGK